jgi:hypothetical protein
MSIPRIASACAAPADLDLCLYDDGEAKRLGGFAGFLGRNGEPAVRHGYAVLGEELFSLVFEKIHGAGRRNLGACPTGAAGYQQSE